MRSLLLRLFFAAVYFLAFFFLTDRLFRRALSGLGNVLALACLFAGLIVSLVLADITVKKIRGGPDA